MNKIEDLETQRNLAEYFIQYIQSWHKINIYVNVNKGGKNTTALY